MHRVQHIQGFVLGLEYITRPMLLKYSRCKNLKEGQMQQIIIPERHCIPPSPKVVCHYSFHTQTKVSRHHTYQFALIDFITQFTRQDEYRYIINTPSLVAIFIRKI